MVPVFSQNQKPIFLHPEAERYFMGHGGLSPSNRTQRDDMLPFWASQCGLCRIVEDRAAGTESLEAGSIIRCPWASLRREMKCLPIMA